MLNAVKKTEFNIEDCRADFPILKTQMNGKPLAFLDSAASAQKPQVVIDAISEVMEGSYSNIHRGLYDLSQNLTTRYENVRKSVAHFIGAPAETNIVFTRNTTEAINLVAQSWGRTFLKQGDEILLTEMEHHANIVPWQLLQKEIGFEIKVIPVNKAGELELNKIPSLLSTRTKFVGCVHISNALGAINNINEIIGLVRDFNPEIKVLIDGTQSVVHGRINVTEMDADFFTFTGHKLYGPTGIGILYGKEEVLDAMPPYQGGGDMIERVSFDGTLFKPSPYKFEAGTPPIIQVIGLGAAIDYIEDIGIGRIEAYEKELLDYAIDELKDIDGIHILHKSNHQAPIISFTADWAHPSDLGVLLDQCGVAIRSGHHCCMPLMEKLGIDSSARLSIGLYTNKDDINQFIDALHKAKGMFE